MNCYSDCTLTSKTWTKFVGALGGMATAISESYDSYYAEDVALTIEDQRLDPPVAFARSFRPATTRTAICLTVRLSTTSRP